MNSECRMRRGQIESSRREFLANGGRAVAGSVLAGDRAVPRLRGRGQHDPAGPGRLRRAGQRGGGQRPFLQDRTDEADRHGRCLRGSADASRTRPSASSSPQQVDVPPERRFVGFDAYRKAIDCLRPGRDVMIQATHSAFRPTHLKYAVEKGVNAFIEKSFAPDPGGTKEILRLGEEAKKKNLKIGCGLMCRHSASRQALIRKIRDGALGDIQLIRAYRMDPGARMGPFKGGESELLWQIRRPYFFLWVSSAWFIEMMIHQVDECCWIKDAWPVSRGGPGRLRAREHRLQPEPAHLRHRVHLPRRDQGPRQQPQPAELPQRVRHVGPRDQVCRPVLGQRPRPDRADVQGSAVRQGQHRLAAGKREDEPVSGRVG